MGHRRGNQAHVSGAAYRLPHTELAHGPQPTAYSFWGRLPPTAYRLPDGPAAHSFCCLSSVVRIPDTRYPIPDTTGGAKLRPSQRDSRTAVNKGRHAAAVRLDRDAQPVGASCRASVAWAAAKRATGTRSGEQLT